MANIINLDKEWENLAEKIYSLLSEQPTNDLANDILSILEEYSNEKEVVELPFKIGETIYEVYKSNRNSSVKVSIKPRVVQNYEIGRCYVMICCKGKKFLTTDINRTIYKTKEKAENALKLISIDISSFRQ